MAQKGVLRLLVTAVLSLLATSFLLGAETYQGSVEDPSKPYLTAHKLVAVEGRRRLNLYCIGQGRPVVLFDGGGGASSAVWRFVQSPVGKVTKACSYDRAGFGFSDPPNGPSDARAAVEDIHRLLRAENVGAVLYVGHSLAGLYGVLLQATYPGDVVAEVLVDPSFADQDFASLAELPEEKRGSWLEPDYNFLASMRSCADRAGTLPDECLLWQADPKSGETALGPVNTNKTIW